MCFDCLTISAEQFVPAHQRWEDHPARKHFEPIKDLGAGSFSQVVLARHRSTGRLAALKIIFLDNPNLDPETATLLQQEGEILMEIKHPNIVKCSDIIRGPRADVLVLEYLRGCNVLDGLYHVHIHYTERDAAGIFTQLAKAVAHLHMQNIIHRDIKPENLVYAEIPRSNDIVQSNDDHRSHAKQTDTKDTSMPPLPPPIVKLVDFGMAWKYDPSVKEKGLLGSAGFVAPELIKGYPHTPAMDVFSMGVLLFVMLVGRKPFNISQCENLQYAKSMTLAEAPGFKDPRWLDLSPDAKHLLIGMLTYDPERRLTAAQVLKHDWVASCGGRVLRMLGADVALGAATVAEMRRLRFLCNGVVALQRTADAKVAYQQSNRKKKKLLSASRKNGESPLGTEVVESAYEGLYMNEFKKMKKRETMARDGGGSFSLRGIARSITARSFKHVHDESTTIRDASVHKLLLLEMSSHAGRVGAYGALQQERSMAQPDVPAAHMRRSNTALLLSELLIRGESPEPSVANGSRYFYKDASVHHGTRGESVKMGRSSSMLTRSKSVLQMAPSVSGMQMLSASVRHYIDVTVRGTVSASRDQSMHSMKDGTVTHGSADVGDDSDELLKVVKVRRSLDGGSSRSAGSLASMEGSVGSNKRVVHAVQVLE